VTLRYQSATSNTNPVVVRTIADHENSEPVRQATPKQSESFFEKRVDRLK
jgi:hypothetical protein